MSDKLVPAKVETELTTEYDAVQDFLAVLRQTVIETEDDLAFANKMLRSVKERFNYFEEQRKFFTAPLVKHCKDINFRFKAVLNPLEEAEAVLKKEIGRFHLAAQQRQEALMLKVARGEAKATALAPVSLPEKTTITEFWDFEVVDESKVPREYLVVSERALREACDADGHPNVPGVRFFRNTRVTVRK